MSTRDLIKTAVGQAPKQYNTLQKAKDEDPSALFKMLLDRKEQAKVVDWELRGEKIKLRVRMLSLVHEEQAKEFALDSLAARNINHERMGEAAFNEQFADAVACEILVKAIQDPEPTKTGVFRQVFVDSKSLRNTLTGDEMAGLFNLYLLVKDELGGFSDPKAIMEDLDGWIDACALGAENHFLLRQPLSVLLTILQSQAMALQHLRRFQPSNYLDTLDAIQGNLGSMNGSSGVDVSGVLDESKSEISQPKAKSKAKKKVKAPKTITPEEAEQQAKKLT